MQVTISRPIATRVAVSVNGASRSTVSRTVSRSTVSGVGLQGPKGDSGQGHLFFDFAFGDAQPVTLFSAPAGKLIQSCEITITEAFDGVGAALTIGDVDQVDRVMAAADSLPSQATTFGVSPNVEYDSETDVKLFITPGAGATAGRGTIAILLQP